MHGSKLTAIYHDAMNRLQRFPYSGLMGLVGRCNGAIDQRVSDDTQLRMAQDEVRVLRRQLDEEKFRSLAIAKKAKEDREASIIANHIARRDEHQTRKARHEEGVKIRARKEWIAYLSVPRRDVSLLITAADERY